MNRSIRVACLTLGVVLAYSCHVTPVATAGDMVYKPDAVLGVWMTDPNDDGAFSHIEVYSEDGKVHGRIIWLSDPVYGDDEPEGPPGAPIVDKKNPDASLRGRPLLGMNLMTGFKHNGKNKWEDGRIYDPENGKEYRCKVTLTDPDTLEVFGYIKVGFAKLGRDTVWKRVVETE